MNKSEMNKSEMNKSEMNKSEIKDLERILANEEELQPTTGFSTRVMRAVREEATATPPIAFPWARFLPGFLLNLGLVFGAAVWMILEPDSSSSLVQVIPTEWFSDPQVQGLLWAALTVVGTGAMAWIASRWVAPRGAASF